MGAGTARATPSPVNVRQGVSCAHTVIVSVCVPPLGELTVVDPEFATVRPSAVTLMEVIGRPLA